MLLVNVVDLDTNAEAGLASGMFHRKEYSINQVKEAMQEAKIFVRL